MNNIHIKYLLVIMMVGTLISACQTKSNSKTELSLSTVASSDKQWTGVAVSDEGRVFINYPYWSGNVPVSMAEIIDGVPRAYPNMEWNQRTGRQSFNAVQSVFIDDKDRLWVLDTNNPQFKGVVHNGPILYQFNLKTNTIEKAHHFSDDTYLPASYFNDVRIDTNQEIAYITDSGDGAIIVLDLKSGKSRRLLDTHPSTQNEVDHLICDGHRWDNSVHTDGIALSSDKKYIYYIALSGHTLYRIETRHLLDEALIEEELGSHVEKVKEIPATDGMLFDKENNLYLGGLETNSVNRLSSEGVLETVIQSSRIRWADSFAMDKDGNLYFTTSQIHLPDSEKRKYEVLKIVF